MGQGQGDGQRQVVWSPAALRQLDEAVAYVAEGSLVAALNLLEEALDAADSLETLSERGRQVPEIRDGTTREVLVQRYRLMYEVSEDAVHIVTFWHSARDFRMWRGRR